MLRQWRALESWVTSEKLGVVRTLIRRHPLPGHEGAPGGLPWDWERELEHEVSAALGMSLVGARKIRTCGCNCHMCSRSCHRTKQSAGWSVTSPRPGFHQWTTPAGRVYVQEPWQYLA